MTEDVTEYELEIKSDEICRACLSQENILRSIFCSDIVDGKIVAFPKIYEGVLDLKINKTDGLPGQICVNCKLKINELYIFKEKCKQSAKLLDKIFGKPDFPESPCKTEPAIEIIDIKSLQNNFVQSTQNESISTLIQQEPECIQFQLLNSSNQFQTSESPTFSETVEVIEIEQEEETYPKLEYEEEHLEFLDEEYITSGNDSDKESNSTPVVAAEYIIQNEFKKLKPPYKCTVCPLETYDLQNYQDHEKYHQNIEKPKKKPILHKECPFCKIKVRGSNEIFVEHIEQHKKTFELIFEFIDLYRCGNCFTIFCNSKLFEEHLLSSDDCKIEERPAMDPANKCTEISHFKEFECAKQLASFEKNFDENEIIYKCNNCLEYKTNSTVNVLDHSYNCEQNSKDDILFQLNCSSCSKWTDIIAEILIHTYFHSEIFQCPFFECGNEYTNFYNLNSHLEKHHLFFKTPICNHCQERFSTYNELLFHLKNKCAMRSFGCAYCGKTFLRMTSKNIHERIHTQDKRFVCKTCGKAFIQCGDLKIHSRVHTGEKPFKCSHCPKTFRTYGNRRDHLTSHSDEKPFECNICSKVFKAERILKSHLKLHTGIKKFDCPVCGKLFVRRQHVISHMRVHNKKLKETNIIEWLDDNDSLSKDTVEVE